MTPAARLTVVVAPDSFKGSLPAHEAAAAIEAGLRDAATAAGVDLEVRFTEDGPWWSGTLYWAPDKSEGLER